MVASPKPGSNGRVRSIILASVLLAVVAVGGFFMLADGAAQAPGPRDEPIPEDPDAGKAGRAVYDDVYYVAARDRFAPATIPATVSSSRSLNSTPSASSRSSTSVDPATA